MFVQKMEECPFEGILDDYYVLMPSRGHSSLINFGDVSNRPTYRSYCPFGFEEKIRVYAHNPTNPYTINQCPTSWLAELPEIESVTHKRNCWKSLISNNATRLSPNISKKPNNICIITVKVLANI